jgi:NADH:ubiquinone oxidoreductase subunit K
MIPLAYYLACSVVLYIIGLYCLVVKRNMIRMLIALEIMLNAANLNFIAFSSYGAVGFTHPLAQAFAIISIGIGGCIIALGLAITIHAYKHYGTLDVRELRRLKE